MCPELWGLSGDDAARIARLHGKFADAFRALAGIGKAVSIFGSARTRPDEGAYELARETARRLGEAGFAIITGGGSGSWRPPTGARRKLGRRRSG